MLGSPVRRFWLLPLVALSLTGLACQKEVEPKFANLCSTPFTIAPGTYMDFMFSIDGDMIRVPRDQNNVTLYAQWTIPSGDTVSVYVLTSDDMDKFVTHQPFAAIREFHGVQDADFWIHDMWEGDYHLVLDNHNPTSVNVTTASIYVLYFGYKN